MKRRDLSPPLGLEILLVLAILAVPNMIHHVKTSPAHEGTRAAMKALGEFVTPKPVNTFVRGAQ